MLQNTFAIHYQVKKHKTQSKIKKGLKSANNWPYITHFHSEENGKVDKKKEEPEDHIFKIAQFISFLGLSHFQIS